MIWKQLEHAGESLDIPRDDHPTILRIRTQLLPLVSAGSTVIFLFYHITCTHTHRHTIQILSVDLYDTYLLIFLIETLLSSGIRTPRYALNMPGASFYP